MFSLTIAVPDISALSTLAALLKSHGFDGCMPPYTMPKEETPAAKPPKKKTEVVEAPITPALAPIAQTIDFNSAEYKAVADATTALSREAGRDAVVALLASYKVETARMLPPAVWGGYITAAKAETAKTLAAKRPVDNGLS